ncbi:hypothetical protein NHX12_033027 [Muraenolepis orangiensis]|uniref:Uncharacterized protein n=1 Tax=Muraenolepis orangiensis TaxID=630683 RepID=A0A9Q0IHL4_9TELE|nr:hypothetical protein NHX12_033027 [Muraenolepis orangiensis]
MDRSGRGSERSRATQAPAQRPLAGGLHESLRDDHVTTTAAPLASSSPVCRRLPAPLRYVGSFGQPEESLTSTEHLPGCRPTMSERSTSQPGATNNELPVQKNPRVETSRPGKDPRQLP